MIWLAIGLGTIAFKILHIKVSEDKSTKPNLTWIGWMLNIILWPFFILKPNDTFAPLNLDKLKTKAMKQSGLHDFGDFDERPYRETIDVVNEYNYTPLGRMLLHIFFVDRLIIILQIQNACKENKSFLEYSQKNKMQRPCFIVGMPRTGSTALHHLLSLDPKVRAPRLYELDYPIPLNPENLQKDKEMRIKKSNEVLKRVKYLAPHLLQSHDVSAMNYEECSKILVNYVPGIRPSKFMFKDKESMDIVLQWDMERAYRNHYKVNILCLLIIITNLVK